MTKKIFVCSDIHEDLNNLDLFCKYAISKEPNYIMIAGDLSLKPYTLDSLIEFSQTENKDQFIKQKKSHNKKTLNEMEKLLENTKIPFFLIPGNYDQENLEDVFENKHKKSFILNESKVACYGGADAYPPHINFLVNLGEITNYNPSELNSLLIKEKPDIILTHNPPYGLCDDLYNGQNVGEKTLTKYILDNSPKLVIAGHIHEAGPLANNPNNVNGINKLNNTLIINSGNLGSFELVDFPSLDTIIKFPGGTFVNLEIEDNGTPIKLTQYQINEKSQIKILNLYNLK